MAAAAAMAAGVGGFVASNWDVPGYVTSLYTTVKGNTAGQEFQKKLSAIDYRIQRQQLHREDLRDLMELTTGRMDIYHVVGTLLLTFCITWFTDNGMLTSTLPDWYITLFLINNFSACGYLMLSVWLAMHTSVSAHTTGVRLLTSYARLSIPSLQELQSIRVDILPSLQQFLDSGKDMLKAAKNAVIEGFRGKASPPTKGTPTPFVEAAKNAVNGMIHGKPRASSSGGEAAGVSLPTPALEAIDVEAAEVRPRPSLHRLRTVSPQDEQTAVPRQEEADPPGARGHFAKRLSDGEEEEQWEDHHFEHFYDSQKRWRCYDKYARVCMTFGVNQMLEALAYYILGVIWNHTPMAAFCSVFAVKLLGVLLMGLDTYTTNGLLDFFALIVFYLLPPLMAGIMVRTSGPRPNPELAVPVCYVLKACWLIYAWHACMRDGPSGKDRLRTVCYLDVLDPEQIQLAQTVGAEQVQHQVERLDRSRRRLEQAIDDAMESEAQKGSVGASTRMPVRKACDSLQHRVDELRLALIGKRRQDVQLASQSLSQAEHALKRFEVWVKTPAILENLEALREGAYWFSDEEKQTIERSYQNFLNDCKRHRLGVVLPDTTPTPPTPPTATLPAGSSGDHFRALQLSMTDRSLALRVDTSSDGFPAQIWYDMGSKEILGEDPTAGASPKATKSPVAQRVTSFNTAFQDMRKWQEALPTPVEERRAAMPLLGDVLEGGSHDNSPAQASQAGGGGGGGGDGTGLPEEVQTHADTAEPGGGRPARVSALSYESNFQSAVDAAEAAGGAPGNALNSGGLRNPGCQSPAHRAARTIDWMTPSATPSNLLPGRVVHLFTFGTALWWLLAVVWYVGTINVDHHKKNVQAELQSMPMALPGPTQFFKISSLHCHRSNIWMSTRFSLYAASRPSHGHASEPVVFAEVAELEEAELAAMMCRPSSPDGSTDTASCHLLMRSPDDSWQLRPLSAPAALGSGAEPAILRLGVGPGDGGNDMRSTAAAHVRMPLPWRVVDAVWTPEAAASEDPPSQALLAGWDGEAVIVSELRRHGAGWLAQPRFEVDPRYGRCAAEAHDGGSRRICNESRTVAKAAYQWLRGSAPSRANVTKYESVRALQFMEEGKVLAILSDDGDLDLWRLATSELLGRWSVGDEHVAMCHDGEHFVVAHNGISSTGEIRGGRDTVAQPGIGTLMLSASVSPAILGLPSCGSGGCGETAPRLLEI